MVNKTTLVGTSCPSRLVSTQEGSPGLPGAFIPFLTTFNTLLLIQRRRNSTHRSTQRRNLLLQGYSQITMTRKLHEECPSRYHLVRRQIAAALDPESPPAHEGRDQTKAYGPFL